MQNSKYFQPMVHRPLPDVRKYALITNQKGEFYAVVRPAGVDVYVLDGEMFDFYHNPIQNQYLKFHFEALLKVSKNMKMAIIGTLTSTNILDLMRHRHTLYGKTRSAFTDVLFVAYDIHFPVFNVDHIYKWRHSIVEKAIATQANCKLATAVIIKDEYELQKFVSEVFVLGTDTQIIVYKSDGIFVPGFSQLTYSDDDTVSYIIRADQRFRAHVKKVVSTTLRMENSDKVEVALYIIAKFKKEFIEVPIDQSNMVLRRFLWDNRKVLKGQPFWFTGYTLVDDNDTHDYVTLINEFLSFINNTDINASEI